nr:MAG TPA: hypothetical protein [Caudoviricetes sp.]
MKNTKKNLTSRVKLKKDLLQKISAIGSLLIL